MKALPVLLGTVAVALLLAPSTLAAAPSAPAGVYVDFDGVATFTMHQVGGSCASGVLTFTATRDYLDGDSVTTTFSTSVTCAGPVEVLQGIDESVTAVANTVTGHASGQIYDGTFAVQLS